MKKLDTILQIASVGRAVSPDMRYGGTARVLGYLDREFTRRGYNSLVGATGDSKVYGELIETVPKSINLWNMEGTTSAEIKLRTDFDELSQLHYSKIVDYILKNKNKIDIIHDHPGSGLITSNAFLERGMDIKIPILVSLHSAFSEKYRERYKNWQKISKEYGGIYFNGLSNFHKSTFEKDSIKINETIYHGLPLEDFTFNENKQDYLFSIGRICPKKGQHTAIEIAKKTNSPLIIAGEVNTIFHNYWKDKIEPYLDFSIDNIRKEDQERVKNDLISKIKKGKRILDKGKIMFLGNLTDKQKAPIYANSKSFLMPITWNEPFGLVMIEAMATGTPVVAYSMGSVPEVIKDGKTGYIIERTGNEKKDIEKMIESVGLVGKIKSKDCRNHVKKKFSIEIEADNYIELYKKII